MVNTSVDRLVFDIRRSIRYHDQRKGFYEFCHLLTNLFTIFMSGVALTDVLGVNTPDGWVSGLIKVLAFVAAMFSAIDLLVGYQKKSSLHDRLKNEFADLEIQLLKDVDYESACTRRKQIEKEEPSTYYALDAVCRNEQLRAEGYSADHPNGYVLVGRFVRATRNLHRWEGSDFPYNVKV